MHAKTESLRSQHDTARRRLVFRDRLRPQLIELTIFALTLLGSSGEVATNLSWASATRAAHKDSALCAYPRERRGNSSTSASDRGDPGSHDDGGPDAFAPHC